MQPYFFPYLRHFDLLNQCDMRIAGDAAQYSRHGWVNRNRVLHSVSGWQYITAPIHQIEIADNSDWKTQVFRHVQHYLMDAPFYGAVMEFFKDCYSISEQPGAFDCGAAAQDLSAVR